MFKISKLVVNKRYLTLVLCSVFLLGIVVLYKGFYNKDGELFFYKQQNGDLITSVVIEFAETKEKRKLGLMHRQDLEEGYGMLFVFPDSRKRFFWMKDTFIPLDIIYVSEDYKIVSILKNTKPLNKKRLPSRSNAKFALEVNAGFSERFNLRVGDSMAYKKF